MTSYYRRFIRGYAQIASLLTNQFKKDCYGLTKEATEAFLRLKAAMTTAPALHMSNFRVPFVVEADASGKWLGVVLM